jgi:hypothetical protein
MPIVQLKRRDFLTLFDGVDVWPLAARAQPGVHLVTVVLGFEQDDEEGQRADRIAKVTRMTIAMIAEAEQRA